MLKTYREVIDKMGKVSLSHIKRRPRENRYFSRWPAGKKREKVSKLASDKISWVEKSLFLGQFFTLATMVILILLKRGLNNQK